MLTGVGIGSAECYCRSGVCATSVCDGLAHNGSMLSSTTQCSPVFHCLAQNLFICIVVAEGQRIGAVRALIPAHSTVQQNNADGTLDSSSRSALCLMQLYGGHIV
jgi:hypothetical protein